MTRLKIDENIHSDAARFLRSQGHDPATVYEQGLRGKGDAELAGVCREEARVIVTLDLDFSDTREYPPGDYPGIIVLRLNDQSRPSVLSVLGRIMPLFDTEPLRGHLWIVDENQVRIRGGDSRASP